MTARSPFGLALRRTLAAAAPITAVAALASALAAERLDPAPLAGAGDAAARSPWLEFVVLVAIVASAVATVRLWPLFARGAPGRDLLRRAERGPLHGCGAVVAGTVVAQMAVLYPVLLLLPASFGAPPHAVARVRPGVAAAAPLLLPGSPRLVFADLPAAPMAAIELRPQAAMPEGPLQPSRVQVTLDGEALGAPLPFDDSGQQATLGFPARSVHRLELELVDGTVPLLFGPDSLWLVEAAPRSTARNALWATLACSVPTFVALAVACLCGAVAALPTVLTAAVVLQFLFVVGGIGPAAPALRHLLRGRWLWGSDDFAACAPSVGAGVLAMILAMLLHRRHDR